MPYLDKVKYNEYLNQYMKDRWKRRRSKAVQQLGGRCVNCQVASDLHFHHKDPSTKVASVAKMSSASEAKFQEELSKCQLLCATCHEAEHKLK